MKKNAVVIAGTAALIGIGLGFLGGTTYAVTKAPTRGTYMQGQGMMGAGVQGGAAGRRVPSGMSANAAFGTIIAKDASSITVQLGGPGATSTNGSNTGSRIVLINSSTEVMKTITGSLSDLSIGASVVANGTANSDGSITAASIQLRSTNPIR